MKSERSEIWKVLIFAGLFVTLACVSVGCAADTYTVCPGGVCDYTSIQAAIDAAIAGDTIEVYSGTYYENVNVDEQLTLIGVGKPVVDARGVGSAITISHDGIVLDGFTAINASSYPQAGILVTAHNNIISNNTNSNNYFGIYLYASSNNNLKGNTASNSWNGIYLYASSNNNNLKGNTASNNSYGIILDSASNNNTVSGNSAYSNNQGIYLGSSSNNNTISDNTAYSNNYGIFLYVSNNNTLTDNTVFNNSNNGIVLISSSNNNITDNKVFNNSNYGIYLHSSTIPSNSNRIYNNYFDNTNNAYDDGTNIWNITQTSGTNIIGGSWLGGNYWSDYTGDDTNADGLGNTLLPYDSSGTIQNGGDWLPLVAPAFTIFDTDEGTYPSISGIHNGTITPYYDLSVSRIYTYPCIGTGGHTKSIELYENDTLLASGVWEGYQGDWHNITLVHEVTLLQDREYRYVITTGSYPQVIHAESKAVTGGTITCTEFVDINGKTYTDWIPAIKLF